MSNQIWFQENVTAEEWEAFAQECDANARAVEQDKHRIYAEDGYAFYHGAIMDKYFRMADLARNQGINWVWGLVDLDGNLVNAEIVNGKYGKIWCIKKEDGAVEWVNVSVASTVCKEQIFYGKKGYQLAKVEYRFCEYKGQLQPIHNSKAISVVIAEDDKGE